MVKKQGPRDAGLALRKLAAYRAPSACSAMITLLQEYGAKLPEQLPGLPEIQAMEVANREHPELWGERWKSDYDKALGAAVSLILQAYPEGVTAAEGFYSNLQTKWGDTEASRPLLKALRSEMDSAHRTVKEGIAPWQLYTDGEPRENLPPIESRILRGR